MEKYALLSNGQKMPLIGLGTWLATSEKEIETAINEALTAGYRHFDTAYMYTNETTIGKVLKQWLDSGKIKREELFIVTKLPMIGMTPEKAGHFLKKSLEALQLSYVDLYLIHSPIGFKYASDTELLPRNEDNTVQLDMKTNLEAVWKSLETEVDAGRAKSIGISNFNSKQIERIVKAARIQPVNIQVELHVYHQQKSLQKVCAKHDIVICAFAPIGSPGRKALYESRGLQFQVQSPLDDPVIQEIAKKHMKTPAQVALRFLIQQGIVAIPKSTNPDRLKSNIDVFDFVLGPVDIGRLEALDRGEAGRTFSAKSFPGSEKHPEIPYE